jgi:hypothetical protein
MLAFISETERGDLSAYCWRHPFLGTLNVYEWVEMIAAHQLRRTKQVREIEAELSRKLEEVLHLGMFLHIPACEFLQVPVPQKC